MTTIRPRLLIARIQTCLGSVKSFIKELTADDPYPRLHLLFMMASCFGGIGVVGFLFGLFGGLLKLIGWLAGDAPHPELNVLEVLDTSFWRIVIGYGAAVVIHAVAKPYAKTEGPDAKLFEQKEE